MEVIEKKADGLERAYQVTIPAAEIDRRVGDELQRIKGQVSLKGFRPGKAPVSHLKKLYGRHVIGDVVQALVTDASRKALDERSLRPAAQPTVNLISDAETIADGGHDLSFEIEVEVMPDFTPLDASTLTLTKKVAEPDDADVDEALRELADAQRPFEEKDGAAGDGDRVVVNYVGKVDGEPFEGGTAQGAEITLGRGGFIPGFEEGLTGLKAGDEKTIDAEFPDDYPAEVVKGKTAQFDITCVKVLAPGDIVLDDGLAQKYGMESLDALKGALKERIAAERARQTRAHLKRELLDKLDAAHDFPLPPKMVEAEFRQIWSQVEQAKAAGQLGPEDEGKSDEELKTEYRAIAERRVRLGLVLAEIGRVHNVQVSERELGQALAAEARRHPGQERQVYDFFRQNPGALAQLRAPLFEEKVVDFITELADVTTKTVSKEALAEDPDGRLGEDGAAAAGA